MHFAFHVAHHAGYITFGTAYHGIHRRGDGGSFRVTANSAVVTAGIIVVIPACAIVVLVIIFTASGEQYPNQTTAN